MKKIIQFTTDEERLHLIEQNSDLSLIAERNNFEGNFLVFSDNPTEDIKTAIYVHVPKEEFEGLKADNTLLKAQSQANSDRADFQEELIVELATIVYA